MINTNYLFIIDKDNYKDLPDYFMYGFKLSDNYGFYLEWIKTNDSIATKSSSIMPIVVYFRKDDYWALSNSVPYLQEYLLNRGYSLTENSQFKYYESQAKSDFSFYYPEVATSISEIKIVPNDSKIEIIAEQLNIVPIKNNLFSKSILEPSTIADLISWKECWQQYFKDLKANDKNMRMFLSGGLDSRLLWFLFGKDVRIPIINRKAKPNIHDDVDQQLATQVLSYYNMLDTATLVEEADILNSIDSWDPSAIVDTRADYFTQGIMFHPKKFQKIERQDSYQLFGTASNVYKLQFKDLKFLKGNVRRNWVTKIILKYYLYGTVTIMPFLDERLLALDGLYPHTIHIILYKLFAKDLIENKIQFRTAKDLYYLEDLITPQIEEILKRLELEDK